MVQMFLKHITCLFIVKLTRLAPALGEQQESEMVIWYIEPRFYSGYVQYGKWKAGGSRLDATRPHWYLVEIHVPLYPNRD